MMQVKFGCITHATWKGGDSVMVGGDDWDSTAASEQDNYGDDASGVDNNGGNSDD